MGTLGSSVRAFHRCGDRRTRERSDDGPEGETRRSGSRWQSESLSLASRSYPRTIAGRAADGAEGPFRREVRLPRGALPSLIRGGECRTLDFRRWARRKCVSTIETIGVIGAGTMGNGIAQVAAQAGFEVVL